MKIAVDIDHTISQAAWRDEYINEAIITGKWDLYHSLSVNDKPAEEIINLILSMQGAGHEVYIVTARPRKWLRQTYSWLRKHNICVDQEHILMRAHNDYSQSPELKLGLVDGLNIDLLIEDREDVCKAFAEVGIATLQVRLVS
jgi:uncharacterized HAD superfamily protein